MSEEERSNLEESNYRTELDAYSGPLDLLLYLLRREEVDIFDIPIVKITDQFIAYLEAMEAVNIEMAGEFLVMAATLMEIKSRLLLPPQEEETADGEEEADDPRLDLVRQLIEYRKFKEASNRLLERSDIFEKRFSRPRIEIPAELREIDDSKLLENVTVFDLMRLFSELLQQTRVQGESVRRIVYDDVPVHVHVRNVLDQLRAAEGSLPFLDFFSPGDSRPKIIGVFLALLELIRQKFIRVRQEEGTAQISVSLRDDAPEDIDESMFADFERQAAPVASVQPAPPGGSETNDPSAADEDKEEAGEPDPQDEQ
ncbi:MAG TPA: segregation/condensation protein A [Candidatus Brocadiia bacterium]|nr:segregation/condensation protein A [Candidatus Brocadiia bacterium]